jgi:hypothetical protein
LLSVSLFALEADADCLTGAGSTGFESGSQTYVVSLMNSPTNSTIEGSTCTPNWGWIDPGMSTQGAGHVEWVADYGGYSMQTSVSTGGESTGTSYASTGGTASWVFRVDSHPGYAGPTSIDIDLTALLDISGSISVSGAASAGGTYQSEWSIRRADTQFGAVILLVGNGALYTASPGMASGAATIEIDTDYVLQIHHQHQVLAGASVDSETGVIGTSASSGTSRLSFAIDVDAADQDPLLEVYYPMQAIPGVDAPFPGSAPEFPIVAAAAVPMSSHLTIALLCLVMIALAVRKAPHPLRRR